MYIDINNRNIVTATMEELICADIVLGIILEHSEKYDYDMIEIKANKEAVSKELEKRLAADLQRKIKNLENRREALLPDDVKLKNIESEIEELKKKVK